MDLGDKLAINPRSKGKLTDTSGICDMALQITTRDVDLLRWINGLGFVEICHVVSYWDVQKPTAYARMQKLVKAGYLVHTRMFHLKNGHYGVTKKGSVLAHDELSPLDELSLGAFGCDMIIVQLSMELTKKHSAKFLPKRRLNQEKDSQSSHQKRYSPDGILEFSNQRKIAVEVEPHNLGYVRRKSIIEQFESQTHCEGLWYFCGSDDILDEFMSLARLNPSIKGFDLTQCLNGQLETQLDIEMESVLS